MQTKFQRFMLLLAAVATVTKADTPSKTPLLQLVANRFGKLSIAEEKVVSAVVNEKSADCSGLSGEEKDVRGELISWLCRNPDACAQISSLGISIIGAEISSKVDLARARISFPIAASKCVFDGPIDLSNSHVAFLSLEGGSANQLVAKYTYFEGSVNLQSVFKAGGVNLAGARIDGDLTCEGGQFLGRDPTYVLYLSGVEIKGNVYLTNPFRAQGGVNLVAAQIDGHLYCGGGKFVSEDEIAALDLYDAKIKGSVFLDHDFKAEGGVNLGGVKIYGDLGCEGGYFVGHDMVPALNASSCKIEGNVFLRQGFEADGRVIFFGGYVGRKFQLSDVKSPEKMFLDLQEAKVGTLLYSRDSWPIRGRLFVDGLAYDQIDYPTEVQLDWLRLQDGFFPQPFEQLAALLRRKGSEEEARKVMIAKNEEHARYVKWRPEWLWYGVFGHLIGYGYSPWRAFGISWIVIAIGWWLFRRGYRRGLVTPTGGAEYTVEQDGTHPSSSDYPKFNAFVYSLENFVPIVKLGISENWEPNGSRNVLGSRNRLRFPPKTGGWLRGYLWIHIILGWVLTTLWVGGITGLVKT
jgi:hypothetical protein